MTSGVGVPVAGPFAYKQAAIRLAVLDAGDRRDALLAALAELERDMAEDPQIYLDCDADPAGLIVVLLLIQPLRSAGTE